MIGIGLAGTAANAVVLYALILHNSRETKKRVINWLVINQNLLDLCCCVVLIIILSLRVSNIYLAGAFGYVGYCMPYCSVGTRSTAYSTRAWSTL